MILYGVIEFEKTLARRKEEKMSLSGKRVGRKGKRNASACTSFVIKRKTIV
jgi:hypothetical protein